MTADLRRTAAELADDLAVGDDHQRRADPGRAGPDRCRRRRGARVPPGRHRGRAGGGPRVRRAARVRPAGVRARRRADRGQGRARHQGAADHVRLEDPRGLGAAVRRDRGRQGARGRAADPRQDQHGRVRDGLLHRALGVRRHAQPVGPDPDPGRLRRRLVGRGGGVRGADRDRHRHRRLDPPARRGHRHGRREADLRRRVALRPRGAGQLARPGRTGDPDRPRRGAAARDHRRPRPEGLHLDRPAAARAGRGRPAGRDRRPDRACGSAWSPSSAARATRPAC